MLKRRVGTSRSRAHTFVVVVYHIIFVGYYSAVGALRLDESQKSEATETLARPRPRRIPRYIPTADPRRLSKK